MIFKLQFLFLILIIIFFFSCSSTNRIVDNTINQEEPQKIKIERKSENKKNAIDLSNLKDNDISEILATGSGKNLEEAKENAFRSAIEKTSRGLY